jgi:hypothetical protein
MQGKEHIERKRPWSDFGLRPMCGKMLSAQLLMDIQLSVDLRQFLQIKSFENLFKKEESWLSFAYRMGLSDVMKSR